MKKLLYLILLASVNCYAIEPVYQPLKEVNVLIEHLDKMPVLEHQETKDAMCTASAEPASGFANGTIIVEGYVTYALVNRTTTTQNYWVDEYMCVNGYGCTHIRNTVTLNPNGTGDARGIIYNTETLPKGTFVDEATIQITGESTCFVQGSNTVSIS